MKILHTADWHLGKKLGHISRIEEQEAVMEEICLIAEQGQIDAILIAGDIFDSVNPSIEALELFYRTARRLSRHGNCAVIGIAGNHDSPDRIEAPDPLARACGIMLTGYPQSKVKLFALDTNLAVTKSDKGFIEVKLPNCADPLRILLTPYANELRLKTYLNKENAEEELRQLLQQNWQEIADKYCDSNGVNVLMTHLYVMKKGGEKPEEYEGEKSVLTVGGAQEIYSENFPSNIQYVALGHIHRGQQIDKLPCPIVYSGSPLAYSMSEAGQQKYVYLLDAAPNTPISFTKKALSCGKQLVRISFEDIDEAVEWLQNNPNTIVELTIITDNYLTAEQRKQLYTAHENIFIHLQLQNPESLTTNTHKNIDLTRSMEDLFQDFFQHKHAQVPNHEIMNLFQEIMTED